MKTERHETGDDRQRMALGPATPSRMKGDDIAESLLAMAVRGIRVADAMARTTAGRHIASQLLRSVTACGANYEEARGAESRRDFVHKLAITRKEAHEARYWVRLAQAWRLLEGDTDADFVRQLDSICRILGKSISTARARASSDESGATPVSCL